MENKTNITVQLVELHGENGMLKWLKPKRISLLGVDISPTSIKILKVSRCGSELCIESYAWASLPSDVFENKDEQLISCIKRLLSQINSSAKITALAVPDSAVIRKTIQLVDNLNDFEMEELIFLEANNYFSYPVDKTNLDFVVLGPSINSQGMVDVLLMTSKDGNLKKVLDILKNIGLEVKIVDVASYAIAHAVEQLIPRSYERLAIIHINNESMGLFVWENGRCIDEQIISLEIDELEIISSSSDYLDGIFLTGEHAELKNLAQRVQEKTGIETIVVNPFKNRIISKNINLTELIKIAPLFAVAMGLVLRLANDY